MTHGQISLTLRLSMLVAALAGIALAAGVGNLVGLDYARSAPIGFALGALFVILYQVDKRVRRPHA